MERDQNKRLSISELFDHPWISEIQPEDQNEEEVQLDIQKNLVNYNKLSHLQKIVLSLLSGLSSTQEELQALQREFTRLDQKKQGTIGKDELSTMIHGNLKDYDIKWDEIISDIDQTGDKVIDFQQFMSACVNRKQLSNKENVKIAFKILDADNDGKISI